MEQHRVYQLNDESIDKEEWRIDGRLHRGEDLPASIQYHDNGSVSRKVWYNNGYVSREGDKPALIDYANNYVEFWEDGECIRKEQYSTIKSTGKE